MRNENGGLGEEYAASMLKKMGYRIVAKNFRTRLGEIDLIAENGGTLAFVEVKTRAANSLTTPGAAVTTAKQRRLILAAESYLQSHPSELQPRFDVIEIVTETTEDFRVKEAHHLEDAFCLTEKNHRH